MLVLLTYEVIYNVAVFLEILITVISVLQRGQAGGAHKVYPT